MQKCKNAKMQISHTLKQLQTKLITKLQNCKHCIATLICGLCLFVPHNISAVCDYLIDMNGYSLTNVHTIQWYGNRNKVPAFGAVTIGGVKYISIKEYNGYPLTNTNSDWSLCTSSNGKKYWLFNLDKAATSICPVGSTFHAPASASGHPTGAELKSVVGQIRYYSSGCRTDGLYLHKGPAQDFYYLNTFTGFNVDWNTNSITNSRRGIVLCKLDFQ